MRVKVREIVDIDFPVNLSILPPWTRIVLAIQKAYRGTKFYKRREEKRLELEYREQVVKEEKLKETLLSYIYSELVRNNRLGEHGLVCDGIDILVDRGLEDILRNVVRHKEFLSNDIKIVETNPDMLRSFPNLPILVEIRRKKVES